MKAIPPLQWPKRPRREISRASGFPRRIWQTKCRRYRVVESNVPGLPTVYYANFSVEADFACGGGVSSQHWLRASNTTHRKLSAAMAACEKHYQQEQRKASQ